MKRMTTITTALLLTSLTGGVCAAPKGLSTSRDTITYSQAEVEYGYPIGTYLDGKGGAFWLFALPEGRRLMIQVEADEKPVRLRVLPPSWKAPLAGHVSEYDLNVHVFAPAPRRRVMPLQAPPDHYHPGLKLLARIGEKPRGRILGNRQTRAGV